MVAQHPERNAGAMVSRMRAPAAVDPASLIGPVGASVALPSPTAFNIEIRAGDGELLLRLFERNGRLACEASKGRLDEATKAFLYQMLQWSGQVGIRWKDDVKAAVEGQ